jgi:hypothetical protein
MPINVSEALDIDTAEVVTVIRTTSGSYVDGLYVKGTESTFKALASVQQPTPDQVMLLPEGERNDNNKLFICNKRVYGTEDRDANISDMILYKSKRYKVVQPKDWTAYGHSTVVGVQIQ